MNPSLTLYAGKTALKMIAEKGLQPDLFKVIAGAAGGPKWFTLHGLDQYLFDEFLPRKKETLYSIGSSAGAWRLSCLAQKKPLQAIDRLAEKYSNETYSEKPNAAEITAKAKVMLDYMLGDNGAEEIVSNKKIQSHFVTNRCKGLLASDKIPLQMMGLASAAVANIFSRNTLKHSFERVVFYSNLKAHGYFKLDSFATTNVLLTDHNLRQSLLASGSIPVVLEGVKNISRAPDGVYRDGGITDYHFDFPFTDNEHLVIYPHFSTTVLPGWFDKYLPVRKVTPANYDNVLLLVPSVEHVAKLPYGKISDRTDFHLLDDKSRLRYWKTVLSESQRLADEFQQMVDCGVDIERIKPLFYKK